MAPPTPATPVLALVPAFNEARHVAAVVAGVGAHLPVVVVDDGSTDDTAERARDAGAEVLRLSPNGGKGAALRAGFRLALERGATAVVTLDADGQHDPGDIPALTAAWRQHDADLVIGRRDFARIPPVRRVANSLGRLSLSWALGRDVPDNQSGFRLLSRRMMEAVLESAEAGFEFEVAMLVECVVRDYVLAWAPIRTIYGPERSHIRPLHHAVHFARMVRQARRAARAGAGPSPGSRSASRQGSEEAAPRGSRGTGPTGA